MPDKISKALAKLPEKEKKKAKEIFKKIKVRDFTNLDVKKIAGQTDIYRVRKGDLRIIYQTSDDEVIILALSRRSEKTYKKF